MKPLHRLTKFLKRFNIFRFFRRFAPLRTAKHLVREYPPRAATVLTVPYFN